MVSRLIADVHNRESVRAGGGTHVEGVIGRKTLGLTVIACPVQCPETTCFE
jgi:hypothetical protein